MKEGKPSVTAMQCAVGRAYHQVFDSPLIFEDPLAVRILGPQARGKLEATGAQAAHTPRFLNRSVPVVRARYAEDALAAAAERGIRQYVILGAGLDTFAYRSPLAAGMRIFEVDHPATQQTKRQLLANAGIREPANLTFVPVDFEREKLRYRMSMSGVDFAQPAFVSWLGVINYLLLDDIYEALCIARSFPGGSEIALDYNSPPDPESKDAEHKQFLRKKIQTFANLGEPFRTFFRPAFLISALRGLGFNQIENLNSDSINERYFSNRADALRVSSLYHLARARV
jgi:methyltransferase (TIGR00027 family)